MTELVIGATGFIGSALIGHLGGNAYGTSSRPNKASYLLDLLDFEPKMIPDCDTVYICAGANGAKACEGNQQAFRLNVDAPIEIARLVHDRGGFTVWISSMSVEWLSAAYQRQKLAAESILRGMPSVGVVRAGRVVPANIESLCATLARVGRERIAGVTRWGNDDIAYAR